MRLFFTLINLLYFYKASGQNLTGKYVDHFGHSLEFAGNNTFKIDWRFDLAKTWSKGKWRISNDTVYLKYINIYDTLSREGKADSLVLSIDEKPKSVNEVEYAIRCMASITQRADITDKLYYKRGRLFLVDKDGRVSRKKVPGYIRKTKYHTWYFKKA